MRERWFGATGRLVPEIAVEGEVELDDALVLDDVSDETALKKAHEQGRPVVVRADSPETVKQALTRPEVACDAGNPWLQLALSVACVLVSEAHRELLELDLTELTYG